MRGDTFKLLALGLILLICLAVREPLNKYIDARHDERRAELVDANMKRLADATNASANAIRDLANNGVPIHGPLHDRPAKKATK
jgi:hypothetical protein